MANESYISIGAKMKWQTRVMWPKDGAEAADESDLSQNWHLKCQAKCVTQRFSSNGTKSKSLKDAAEKANKQTLAPRL